MEVKLMYEGINLANLALYYSITNEENKERIDIAIEEDKLLTELKNITNQELASKIENEFKPKYHDYNFGYYLEILERCKRLILKGYDDFNEIRKIIYKRLDYYFDVKTKSDEKCPICGKDMYISIDDRACSSINCSLGHGLKGNEK